MTTGRAVENEAVTQSVATANGDRRAGNAAEQVANLIREKIISGALAPGLRLSQADVAREFEVSRTPLREALHKLEAEGLVVTHANRGMSVAPAPLYQVEDAYAQRLLVEPPMVRVIVKGIDDGLVNEMSRTLEIMEQDRTNTRDFQEAHFAFHDVITGRYPKAVSRLVQAQTTLINRHQRIYFSRPTSLSDFTDADRVFLEAVSKRRSEAAAAVMQYHLLDAAIGLIREVEPDYKFDPLLVICEALGISLSERSDSRFDIGLDDRLVNLELSETSNLVPIFRTQFS